MTPTRPSRNGEVEIRSDFLNRAVHRWFRQLRRLQSYLQSVRQGSTEVGPALHRSLTWSAILRAPGFQDGFSTWWFRRPIQQYGAPVSLPQLPPKAEVAQCIFDDFQANFRRMESWSLARRGELIRSRNKQFSRSLFSAVKDEPRPHLDTLVQTCNLQVLEVESDGVLLDSALPDWTPSSAKLDGHFVKVRRVNRHRVRLTGCSEPEAGQQLALNRVISDFDEIESQMLNLWRTRWQRHLNVPPEAWDRIVQFGLAYLPSCPMPYVPLDLDLWKASLRRHKPRTATGPDGWSLADLKALPDSLHSDLVALYATVESEGRWPSQLTTGFVCATAKTDDAVEPTHFRPITVVSLLFRLWASTRSRQMLGHLAQCAPPGLFGYMKGKRPSDIWYYVQACAEATVCLAGCLSGYVSDLIKCFNCLPRDPIFRLASKLGLPAPIIKAWRAGVDALERRFRIRNEIGQATTACTGFAEGDPLSCVAITIMDFCFHLYLSRYAPRCQAISYVDNLELLGHSGSELHQAYLVMETFLEAWDLEQDSKKCFTWAVDVPTRKLLRGLGHQVALASKDLGSQMNYGGQSRIGVLLDRISSLDRFWTRLRTVTADLRSKLHILRTMAWPRALFGAENLHFSEAHTDHLRSRAMWAMKWNRPGASPLIRMSFMYGVSHDPGFHQVWETLKTFHRHIVVQPEARHWWAIFLASWNRVSGQGPMRKLFHVFETLGWSLAATGELVIDGISRPWISCPLVLLKRLAERSWLQHVCRRLRVRQDFAGLDSVDVNISSLTWPQLALMPDCSPPFRMEQPFRMPSKPSLTLMCLQTVAYAMCLMGCPTGVWNVLGSQLFGSLSEIVLGCGRHAL